ncbi:Mitochondrial ribonuclease P catalytic subunit [Triplophysa tibetana]|uniref:Mitochondrial ribonuclease P catalytic subunit n=1 Tax=Triplophysa tibetana TaxID=1572043 RepID=A0A5A9NPL2_9TELE|nr:Mitochondrial ribonuclease P catalytic subunit [Triplophysa tibetana]
MGSLVMLNSKTCVKHFCTWVGSPVFIRPAWAGSPKCTILHAVRFITEPKFHSTKGDNHAQSNNRTPKEQGLTLRARPAFPKSVFTAGTARRTAEYQKRRAGPDAEGPSNNTSERRRGSSKVPVPPYPLTTSEWAKLKEASTKPDRFAIQMMEGLLVSGADVDIAKSLLSYEALERGTLPYELLLRYLTLCVMGGHHSEVFDTYDIMRSCFKTLDTGASSLFVKGFSRTDRWREALVVLEGMKKALLPSPGNYGDVIAGAARHGDTDTSWMLYDELLEKGLPPHKDTWQCLFQSGIDVHEHEDKLLSILSYMRDNQIYPEEPLVKTIKAWFESGECKGCKAPLESIQLTKEEYAQLKDRVMKDVIEGKDIFNKTTPEELESFKSFVKRRPPFDVVIDGLNVANTTPKAAHSETLLEVISELKQQGLNILVLGRKHMLRPSWNCDRQNMNKIKQKAHCFFTENISRLKCVPDAQTHRFISLLEIMTSFHEHFNRVLFLILDNCHRSEDDPFLLYATLHSGDHCQFLSRDLMRDHKACFPDSVTRRLFFKWQRGHQLVISQYIPGKPVRFQRNDTYDTIVQTTGRSWHIPYDEIGGNRATYEVPQNWLCLTQEH